jgi:hypothetical protein
MNNNVCTAPRLKQESEACLIFSQQDKFKLEKTLCIEVAQEQLALLNATLQQSAKPTPGEVAIQFERKLTIIRKRFLKEWNDQITQKSYTTRSGQNVECNSSNKDSFEQDWRKRMNELILQLKKEIPIASEDDLAKAPKKLEAKVSSLLEELTIEKEDITDDNDFEIPPFFTESTEQKSVADLILQLLNHPEQYKPSKLAQLPEEQVSGIIKTLDCGFATAHKVEV